MVLCITAVLGANPLLYLIASKERSVIERVWDHCQCQDRDIPMYRARVAHGQVSWVVELDSSKYTTRFLLEFSGYVEPVAALN